MHKEIEKKALEYFTGDYNCSQSVLRTILEEKGAYFDQAPFVTASFGGGIIGRGEICGAVSGAIMALGVLNGQLFDNISDVKDATREDVINFYKLFQEKFRHSTCYGLIGIDPNDPDAKQKASDAGIYSENCPNFVVEAVKIVLEIHKEK
ncbi:MAG: C-GCAxxG-C-C family protein [Candidatus Heimdallarchaeota archaeon]